MNVIQVRYYILYTSSTTCLLSKINENRETHEHILNFLTTPGVGFLMVVRFFRICTFYLLYT